MCTSENFIHYEMKKDKKLKIVPEDMVEEFKREGWKQGKKLNLKGE